ncbi:ABC transporter substrate-binding protein [Bradyrhizobium sp. BRP23]|uniref:ABC transporter substrate-binding protein n=1 Tax=Bradyrhizobium sp. BRP23 TaxID=2793820 RepID=UPI001CD5997C|nr:ABC transporter substrate-binding protein [Bradyrhizobium sp. BRP23]MCA1379286.1 ABC transporter substrate-binding protein [Bradyrhizobium sp. BRP05]MCA1420550.1 ABC transporter substrate-binding protein [Bradyrhizobium sp. BRP23]
MMLLDGRFGAPFAGEMIAAKEGYLPDNISLQSNAADPNFVEAVARQGAIGVTSGHKFMLSAWSGVPVTAFAASLLDTPVVILTLENSGIVRPADLIGMRLGYQPRSEGEAVFDAMMAQLGLSRSQIIKVPDLNSVDSLRNREVDAIISSVTEQSLPSDPGGLRLRLIKPQDYSIHVPGLVYFASSDLLKNRPLLIAKVLEGIIRGWQFTYANYDRSVPLLVGFDPGELDPARVKFELQILRPLVLPIGGRIADYDESRWRTLRDILTFAKLGEDTVPLSQLVDFQTLRNAYRRAPSAASGGAWEIIK